MGLRAVSCSWPLLSLAPLKSIFFSSIPDVSLWRQRMESSGSDWKRKMENKTTATFKKLIPAEYLFQVHTQKKAWSCVYAWCVYYLLQCQTQQESHSHALFIYKERGVFWWGCVYREWMVLRGRGGPQLVWFDFLQESASWRHGSACTKIDFPKWMCWPERW